MQARFVVVGLLLGAALTMAAPARSAERIITLKDHHFKPAETVIPASEKVKLTVRNLDAEPAVFASWDLDRRKTVDAHGEAEIFVGPLERGRYRFYDDAHGFAQDSRRDTAFAFITAR